MRSPARLRRCCSTAHASTAYATELLLNGHRRYMHPFALPRNMTGLVRRAPADCTAGTGYGAKTEKQAQRSSGGAAYQSADKAIVQAFVPVGLDNVGPALPVAVPAAGHVRPQRLQGVCYKGGRSASSAPCTTHHRITCDVQEDLSRGMHSSIISGPRVKQWPG